ncbi:MAG: hypothetical protein JKY01_06265 [Pseudomonadales bacterium]|nr:hypothetical protein [Pseudomonadales bacterium]
MKEKTMVQKDIEMDRKQRRTNIILALVLGSIALIGFVWPLIVMVG